MEESATTAEDGEAIVHDNEMAAEACEEPTAAAAAEAELPEAMDGGQFDALKETLSRVKEVSGVSDDLLNEVDALKIKLKKKLRKASGKDHKAASVPSNTPGVQQGAASSRKKCGKGERQTEVPVVELEMPPADVNGSLLEATKMAEAAEAAEAAAAAEAAEARARVEAAAAAATEAAEAAAAAEEAEAAGAAEAVKTTDAAKALEAATAASKAMEAAEAAEAAVVLKVAEAAEAAAAMEVAEAAEAAEAVEAVEAAEAAAALEVAEAAEAAELAQARQANDAAAEAARKRGNEEFPALSGAATRPAQCTKTSSLPAPNATASSLPWTIVGHTPRAPSPPLTSAPSSTASSPSAEPTGTSPPPPVLLSSRLGTVGQKVTPSAFSGFARPVRNATTGCLDPGCDDIACAEGQLCVDVIEDAEAEASWNTVSSDPVVELNPLHVPANLCDVFTMLAAESSANNKETLGESRCT